MLNQRNPAVVGVFHYAQKHRRSAWDNAPLINGNYITPLDERMAGSPGGGAILIPEGAEVSYRRRRRHRIGYLERRRRRSSPTGRTSWIHTDRSRGWRSMLRLRIFRHQEGRPRDV